MFLKILFPHLRGTRPSLKKLTKKIDAKNLVCPENEEYICYKSLLNDV